MSDPWDGILDPGEEILWQGAPDGGFYLPWRNAFEILFGLVFTIGALVGIGASIKQGDFWPFILLHLAVGLGVTFHGLLWPTYKLRRTFYSLSDRRAFIATRFPFQGRRLESFPITDTTPISLDDGAPGSIWFASRQKRTKNGSRTIPIGFERIKDARGVFATMRNAQRGQQETSDERTL